MLKRRGIKHNVLNAKYHQQEAEIVSHGRPARRRSRSRPTWRAAAPTSSSARASPDLGGLHILGTERHESRRIDRQLRGRSGRQGDPGSSRFFLSLEDDLMRLFGSERISGLMQRMGVEEGEVIEHPLVTGAIGARRSASRRYNFDIRKHLLEYDNVMNQQRTVVYDLRNAGAASARTSARRCSTRIEEAVLDRGRQVRRATRSTATSGTCKGLADELSFLLHAPGRRRASSRPTSSPTLEEKAVALGDEAYRGREAEFGAPAHARARAPPLPCSRSTSTGAITSTSSTI